MQSNSFYDSHNGNGHISEVNGLPAFDTEHRERMFINSQIGQQQHQQQQQQQQQQQAILHPTQLSSNPLSQDAYQGPPFKSNDRFLFDPKFSSEVVACYIGLIKSKTISPSANKLPRTSYIYLRNQLHPQFPTKFKELEGDEYVPLGQIDEETGNPKIPSIKGQDSSIATIQNYVKCLKKQFPALEYCLNTTGPGAVIMSDSIMKLFSFTSEIQKKLYLVAAGLSNKDSPTTRLKNPAGSARYWARFMESSDNRIIYALKVTINEMSLFLEPPKRSRKKANSGAAGRTGVVEDDVEGQGEDEENQENQEPLSDKRRRIASSIQTPRESRTISYLPQVGLQLTTRTSDHNHQSPPRPSQNGHAFGYQTGNFIDRKDIDTIQAKLASTRKEIDDVTAIDFIPKNELPSQDERDELTLFILSCSEDKVNRIRSMTSADSYTFLRLLRLTYVEDRGILLPSRGDTLTMSQILSDENSYNSLVSMYSEVKGLQKHR